MSEFHDQLHRAAHAHGESVGQGLRADAVVTASVDGIRKGRRRRTAAQATFSVVGVAVLGLGAWAVMPRETLNAEPAAPVTAGPYVYALNPGADVNEGDPELLVRGQDVVACGDEVSLTPGVTIHDPAALETDSTIEASLTTLGMAWPEGDGSDPDYDASEPVWDVAAEGTNVQLQAMTLLLDDGEVVGFAGGFQTSGGGTGGAAGAIPVPAAGECLDFIGEDAESGDPLDSVAIVQLWSADRGVTVTGSNPLATVVVDPTVAPPALESPFSPAVDGTTYVIDETAELIGEPLIDLRRQEFLACGADLGVAPGVVRHDDLAPALGLAIAAAPVLRSDDGSGAAQPDAIRLGLETLSFQRWESVRDASDLALLSVPLVLREGEIVGVGVMQEWFGPGEGQELVVPPPGECAGVPSAGHGGDGAYEPVLVTQAWSADLQQPLATVVFSAGQVEYVGLGDPARESSSEDTAGGDERASGPIDAPIPVGELPARGDDDYRAGVLAERQLPVAVPTCAALLADQDYVTPTGGGDVIEARVAVPTWIETGRLYGYGDDALVGGYPIPVGDAPEGYDADAASGHLVVHGYDVTWVFEATWSERDDLPHDDAGLFVELNQVWDCGSPDVIEPGVYYATLVMPGADGAVAMDLMPLVVVGGVPSIPELEAT